MQNDVETFAPRIPKTRKRNGDKPLFPGYVFARLDLESGTRARLRNLPGVRAFVEIGGEPCPVDQSIVEAIRQRVAAWVPDVERLRPGDRVSVIRGSFGVIDPQ